MFLDAIDEQLFEVKRDMYRNGRMVVEVEQKPKGQQWKPSGLSTTEAKYWVYLFSDESFIVVQTARLKRYLDINNDIEKKTFAANSSNPTRGYLLMPEDVTKVLCSELYDEPKEDKS
jgi:hypothetical protein